MPILLLALVYVATIPLTELYHQLDARLPTGQYRIPSLVTTPRGTLLAFIDGRLRRHDITPTIIYLRRSTDDGRTWSAPTPVLQDPTNHTEFSGEPVVDPLTGVVHFVYNAASFVRHAPPCSACTHFVTRSGDDGLTWTPSEPLNVTGPPNRTWGGGLASGVALTRGPHAGRLLLALRHDCGCGTLRASFVIFSDDHGATWAGGDEMILIPQYGGGWTECQVAELHNGSVLMTSRNLYGKDSGQGPRLFARSDDGGATWAANWSAWKLPDPYCEGSLLADPSNSVVYFSNPSNARHRANYSVHATRDGGRVWDGGVVVYGGGAAYSDMSLTRHGDLAVLFERDNYNTVAFGVLPLAGGVAATDGRALTLTLEHARER